MRRCSRPGDTGKEVMIALALLLAPALTAAHSLSAPEVVLADGDGNFSIDVTLEVTTPVADGSIDIDGTLNTDLGELHFDGFCLENIAPGTYVHTVAGTLLDPASNGEVVYTRSLCDGFQATVVTLVQEPVVGTEVSTWTALKSLYR